MGEHLLVPRAQIAHHLLMHAAHMSMEIRPTHTCNVAVLIRTIVPQQHNCVLQYLPRLERNTQVLVRLVKFLVTVIRILFLPIIRKHHHRRLSSAMCARLCLIQRTHPQSTDMAGAVVAGSHTLVDDRVGADEAHLGLRTLRRFA